jgi:hypothetical protein
MTRSEPFDWDYRADMTEGSNSNPPKFVDGDVYEYTLRKSNTGFHAIWSHEGEDLEIIDYDPDLLLQQDPDGFYVGVFAVRKMRGRGTRHRAHHDPPGRRRRGARATDHLRRPDSHVRRHPHDAPQLARCPAGVQRPRRGRAARRVRGRGGHRAGHARERGELTAPLEDGTNELVAELTPAPREEQTQLGEYEDLSSYDVLTTEITIEVDRYGRPGQAIHVAPDGDADGDGTPENPLDLHTAVGFVQPGQQVVLAAATYRPTEAIVAARGNDGTADAPITLMSAPGGRATLDLSESPSGGIHLRGDHWHLHDLEITGSQGYQKPLLVSGHHNVVERIESHHNGDTGVRTSGNLNEPYDLWPSHNLVLSSVAHNNADPLANDADGFAAKLTVGDGNAFRYCISHHNIDDGWDLYAKSTSGPIGDVVVEDSVA